MARAARFALVVCVVAWGASAQTATVAVGHNDPDGIVAPGETVRITAWHTRSSESILAGIGGDLVASNNLGAASNITSALRLQVHGGTYPASHGTPTGGSVVGVSYEFTSHPFFVPSVQTPYMIWTGVEALSFDWTAPSVPQATTVEFNWLPSPAYPDVYAILPSYFTQLNWASLPTTYTGTSLLVVPAPATGMAVVLAWPALRWGRRTRRSRRGERDGAAPISRPWRS